MDNAVWEMFTPLWSDIDESQEFYNSKPHLAHYTSIASAEKIFQSNELWFANPLYMNDHEEVRFGIEEGKKAVMQSQAIAQACGSNENLSLFLQAYEKCYWYFADQHAMDTYVFCMSEQKKDDNDGLLSMWRGYGGNGSGIAVVIDTAKLQPVDLSTLILAKVNYGTVAERRAWLQQKAQQCAELISSQGIGRDQLNVAAIALFERIKQFALFTKHIGFKEEQEWRVAYFPSRDSKGLLKPFCGYSIGARGVEPRLKFKLTALDGVTAQDFSLEKITDRILLGPTLSSRLAELAFHRLLDSMGLANLKQRVFASQIP